MKSQVETDKHKDMSEVTIRRMKTEDAGDVARLAEQLGYPNSLEQVRHRIGSIIDSQQDEAFIAVSEDGVVAGWIHVFAAMRLESEPFAEIGGIIIDSEYRSRGIGKKLLEHAENWAARNYLTKLRVRSRISRKDAHRFFRSFGFVQSKTQHIFDKPLKIGKREI